MDAIQQAISALQEIEQDSSTPRHIKLKVSSAIKCLSENCESSIKVNKALYALEEIGEDSNVQSYTRTQIFNIVSLLEIV